MGFAERGDPGRQMYGWAVTGAFWGRLSGTPKQIAPKRAVWYV